MFKKAAAFLLAAFLFLPSLQARYDRVDSDQRLQFLTQATGSSSGSESQSSSSFQTRLNAIMDTTASAERTSVATDDAKERQRILAAEQAEFKVGPEESEASPDEPGVLKTQDLKKIKDAAAQAKTDGSDELFQKKRQDIYAEFDERIQKAGENGGAGPRPPAGEAGARPESGRPQGGAPTSNLAPSLANNPFYFAPESEDDAPFQMGFQERKPIITSRLMELTGISAQDAQDVVAQASSPEELIRHLMQEYAVTYGEAEDVAS